MQSASAITGCHANRYILEQSWNAIIGTSYLDNPAPLILLFQSASEQIAEKLSKALAVNSQIGLAGDSVVANSELSISYHGVAFTLIIRDRADDFASYKHIFCNIGENSIGSVLSIQLGEHVRGGEKVAAIVRVLLGAGKVIGEMGGALGVLWVPARTITSFDYFARIVSDYENGGIFPVTALVNFQSNDSGEIRSSGLGWLSGQELCVVPSDLPEAEMMRRVVRVVHDIAVNGPIANIVELPGLEHEEVVELRPTGDVVEMRIISADSAVT